MLASQSPPCRPKCSDAEIVVREGMPVLKHHAAVLFGIGVEVRDPVARIGAAHAKLVSDVGDDEHLLVGVAGRETSRCDLTDRVRCDGGDATVRRVFEVVVVFPAMRVGMIRPKLAPCTQGGPTRFSCVSSGLGAPAPLR